MSTKTNTVAETVNAATNVNADIGVEVKFTTKPQYESVKVIGKTIDSVSGAGTFDRQQFKRALITAAAGFDGSQVVVDGADDTGIISVEPADVEIAIELMGGVKSAAKWTFKGAFTAASKADADAIDAFVENTDENASKLGHAVSTAEAMCAANPGSANLYRFVDKDGRRVFVRAYAKTDKNGRVARD